MAHASLPKLSRSFPTAACLGSALVLALVGCRGDSGPAGPAGVTPTFDPPVGTADPLPGMNVEITSITGGTGANGNARPGDVLTVDFTVRRGDGTSLDLSTLSRGAIMVSGPTFNYQRVIASQGDVLANAVRKGLGTYSYRFAVPLPATYLEPYNDSTANTDGELTGQPLLSGTYTVGIELRKDYVVGTETYRDPGVDTFDFLVGDATTIETRAVVSDANCNQCHAQVRAHGNNRLNVSSCVLCHTAGAEDRNDPNVAGGTPGASIDFKVMIHKIHAGATLPSVLGVTTNTDGSRKYDATPQPYQLVGFGNSVHDYSHVRMPNWPSLTNPMPRDTGYATLTSTQQGLENLMRSGPADCTTCHGDPDGSGPLAAPAQGDLIYAQPTRAGCVSCHDDWVPHLPYRANTQTMPAQRDDAACKNCHRISGTPLDVMDAHRHPLMDPAIARGVRFDVSSVFEVGGDNDGTFDPGEKIGVTFRVVDGSGADIPAASISRIEMVLNGPTTNPNMVHMVRVIPAGIGAGPTYTVNVPQALYLEPLGTSSAGPQNFGTMRAPHWNVSGAATTLFRRTASGAATTLAQNAVPPQNYLDVATGTGSLFANGNYVVVEDLVPGRREFLRVQSVDGDRLWLSSIYSQTYPPRINFSHAVGATVQAVTLATVPAGSYTLDRALGTIAETTEFGDGEILASYTTDFVVPQVYPGALNETPDLEQSWGDWTGLPMLSGTYSLGVFGARSISVTVFGETTSYNDASQAAVSLLRFGDAATVQTVERIAGAETCNACHTDITFHGNNRRGYNTCILCHGTAGGEDAARYVNPNGAATPGVTIDFRTMLHKIHHGRELSDAAGYTVAGFGGTGHTYEHVGFPVMPGGTMDCKRCHGANNTAWMQPADRNHPLQTRPTRAWRAACGSCHDSSAAQAHIDANTSPAGGEACAICHGTGKGNRVEYAHRVR